MELDSEYVFIELPKSEVYQLEVLGSKSLSVKLFVNKLIKSFKKIYIAVYYIHLIIYMGNILYFNYKYIYPLAYFIKKIFIYF